MKSTVIIPNYNGMKFIENCMRALEQDTSVKFHVCVVDNGSTDGTVEYLKSLTGIKTIFNTENLGFSIGNNQGVELADGEFIGFLNNDILLSPNWFEECESVFEKENVAFISPRHINPHFHKVNENNYLKYFSNKFHYKKDYEKTFDECQFSCVITKRSILDKLGCFDENFTPAFFEDNDFKYRAIESGYDCFVSNKTCFFHYGSVTSEQLNHKFEDNRNYYYNKHRFAEYLSLYADENQAHRFQVRYFEQFPMSVIYKIHLFNQKVMRNLKRIIKP